MLARAPQEEHRASTPLELFFDLVFVVAVALNAAGLHHAIVSDHAGSGIVSYLMQFCTIWWAWMGFTWMASAFDADDVPYRLLVFVQMAGALVIAAGIPLAFEHFDYSIITCGYIILRIGLVSLWLRAGRANPAYRVTTRRYAIGLVVGQFLWISLLFAPTHWKMPLFGLFMLYEMCVPVWAERAKQTTPHPEHINERYSLFTIIVLGESILATVNSIKNTLDNGSLNTQTLLVLLSAILIVFSLWWLYFDKPERDHKSNSMTHWFAWGYGHYFVFASAAAIGVGVATTVEWLHGTTTIAQSLAQWALAIPVAAFLLSVWLVHFKEIYQSKAARIGFPFTAAVVLGAAGLPSIVATALVTAVACCTLLAILLHRTYHSPLAPVSQAA